MLLCRRELEGFMMVVDLSNLAGLMCGFLGALCLTFALTLTSGPEGVGPSRAPVIEASRPALFPLGLVLICAGFALQLPAAVRAVFWMS